MYQYDSNLQKVAMAFSSDKSIWFMISLFTLFIILSILFLRLFSKRAVEQENYKQKFGFQFY